MKIFLLFLLFTLATTQAISQQVRIDSLKYQLHIARNDTLVMVYSDLLARAYNEIRADSGIFFFQKAIELAQQLHYKINEAAALSGMGYALEVSGNNPQS